MRTGEAMSVTIRPFREADYPRLVEIGALAFPDQGWNEEEIRYRDAAWDHRRYEFVRLVAEDQSGRIVGFGRFNQMPWQFSAHTYDMTVVVDPASRGRGTGSAIYDRIVAELRGRGATVVRGIVSKETEVEGIAFLTRRGFAEVQRGWESRLDVASFDAGRFAGADERVGRQGVTITTLGALRERDPEAVRKAYDLYAACSGDVPAVDPITTAPFELFVKHEVESPKVLLDAFFVALDGGRYVGLSQMHRRLGQPEVLSQELTGVAREYRGRGIAMALKLRTVAYARAHGYREIRTGNDVRNRPMLRINEALGFAKQPAWIWYERGLEEAS